MALNKRYSQADLCQLEDYEYREYLRAELSRAREARTHHKRGVVDVLLTMLFFIGVVLIILHQNGLLSAVNR